MGGTIVRLASQGHKVHLIDVTNGEPTPHGTPEKRAIEAAAAARVLGVERTLLGLKNREVVHTVENRHKMAALYREHRPDAIFLPYPNDAHPDHVAVTRIGEDARFDAKLTKSAIPGEPFSPKRIIYYFCTHLRLNFTPTFCMDISDQIDTKIKAVSCYESQFLGIENGLGDVVTATSRYFGSRIGVRHAEPFFTYEMLGFRGLNEMTFEGR